MRTEPEDFLAQLAVETAHHADDFVINAATPKVTPNTEINVMIDTNVRLGLKCATPATTRTANATSQQANGPTPNVSMNGGPQWAYDPAGACLNEPCCITLRQCYECAAKRSGDGAFGAQECRTV